jgi:6-phosphogluconolactonase
MLHPSGPVHLSQTRRTVRRPGCTGLRAAEVARGESWAATALYFSEHASSDDHAVRFDQWLVITRGNGMVSIGDQAAVVAAGDSIQLPKDSFHRYWTGEAEMDALALAFEARRGAEWVRVPDRAALARNAAERFVQLAADATRDRGRFSVALSGGSTPRELYALLANPEFAAQIDWAHVYLFWGDERAVPPDDAASNFRMVQETLLSRVPVPPQNVLRVPAENEPARAAQAYARTLREFFGEPAPDAFPRFDLILLGLGENGHTASLFPHTAVLHNLRDWVAAEYVAEVKMYRLTLTAPVINAARHILFLVAGADKAPTVRAVLRGESRPEELPAQLVRPVDGDLVWLLDREAASQL